MMRFFLFASIALTLFSCNGPVYKDLRQTDKSIIGTETIRPGFDKELYRCVVDGKFLLKKFHLSGILYLKNFSDTATRVVFQGEMGNTFFDFGWDSRDSFTVYNILLQMDKPALIKTLKKDFELLLMKRLPAENERYEDAEGDTWLKYRLQSTSGKDNAYAYYVLNQLDNKLKRIENADDKHKVVVMEMTPPATLKTLPDTIMIRHLKANFTVDLKKIFPDAE